MKKAATAGISMFLFLLVTTGLDWAGQQETTYYYRFWRGFKRADITSRQLKEQLAGHFMPATVKINAGKGLVSYTVAIPPADKPAFIPDEFALVAYVSEDRYRSQVSTPEGKKYGEMHWDIFDKSRSKSVVPVKFFELMPDTLSPDVAYDMVGKKTDWQSGYITFSIGLRKREVTPSDFLRLMTSYIRQSSELLSRYGLQGYLVLASEDYSVSYMKWPSKADAEKAFSSGEIRKRVTENAGQFIEPLQSQEVRTFDGTVHDGDFINTKFQPAFR